MGTSWSLKNYMNYIAHLLFEAFDEHIIDTGEYCIVLAVIRAPAETYTYPQEEDIHYHIANLCLSLKHTQAIRM